jgi:hypothetical protein
VRVACGQLQQWYRTLDELSAAQAKFERELFLRLRDLFSLKAEVVFYDVTSTSFEGHGPPLLGRHGYRRDGQPRDRQVLVGQSDEVGAFQCLLGFEVTPCSSPPGRRGGTGE